MAEQFREDPTNKRNDPSQPTHDKSLGAALTYVKKALTKYTDHANQEHYKDLQQQLSEFEEDPDLLANMDSKERVDLMAEFSVTMHESPEQESPDRISRADARAAYMAMADKVYASVGREAPRELSKVIEMSTTAFASPRISEGSGLRSLAREMAQDFAAIQAGATTLAEKDPSILRQSLMSAVEKWRGQLGDAVASSQQKIEEGKMSPSLWASSRDQLDRGLYRLERLIDALEPAEKKQKEVTEKTKAVDKARASVRETMDPGIIERERKEKEILDVILRDGPSQIHTSLKAEIIGSGNSGFQTRAEKKFGTQAGGKNTPTFLNPSGREGSAFETQSLLDNLGVNEVVDIKRIQEDVYENREVEVAKSGLAGMFGQKEKRRESVKIGSRTVMHAEKVAGGKQEPLVELSYRTVDNSKDAQFRDYSNRTGQVLDVTIRLPESLARKSMELMKIDPAFVRKLVEQVMLKQQGIPEASWKDGEKNAGFPLRPPYDKWSAQHGGKSNVYVRSDLDTPIDYKIHNEEIFPVE